MTKHFKILSIVFTTPLPENPVSHPTLLFCRAPMSCYLLWRLQRANTFLPPANSKKPTPRQSCRLRYGLASTASNFPGHTPFIPSAPFIESHVFSAPVVTPQRIPPPRVLPHFSRHFLFRRTYVTSKYDSWRSVSVMSRIGSPAWMPFPGGNPAYGRRYPLILDMTSCSRSLLLQHTLLGNHGARYWRVRFVDATLSCCLW